MTVARPAPPAGVARLALPAAVAVVVAASLASTLLPATPERRLSGDEPHYLITALSLARDGDLDVADQYAAEAYRPFHGLDLRPQGRRLDDGRVVEPHDPLLPALLAVPAGAGGWPAAKAAVAVLAGATAAVVAVVLRRRFAYSPGLTAAAVAGLLGTAPFAVYGAQLYPEVPAALAVAGGLAALLGPPSPWRTGATVAGIVALPWLSVKYVPVAAVLAVALAVGRWRDGRRLQATVAVAVLAAAGAAYVAAHLAWYGGVTVYAAGSFFAAHGGELSVLGTDPSLPGRLTRIVGLMVDRHFGLAAWQPAWLLLVPAVASLVRRRPSGWLPVTAVLLAGWANATFLAATMHGYWFPGRQLVAVLPAAAVAVAWWAGGSTGRRWALTVAAAAGAASFLALLVGGAAGETTAIFFTDSPDPWRWAWTSLLPDYPRGTAIDWVLHGLWIVALAGLAVAGWRSRPQTAST